MQYDNSHTAVWKNHTDWKNDEFSLTKRLFRQINFLVLSLVKALLSRNVWQKCEIKSPQCGHYGIVLPNSVENYHKTRSPFLR